MPLVKSPSEKARQENIRREIESGRPIKQAVAIGYSVQRRAGGDEDPRVKAIQNLRRRSKHNA